MFHPPFELQPQAKKKKAKKSLAMRNFLAFSFLISYVFAM